MTIHENLEAMLLNERYNEFLSSYADYEDDEYPIDPTIANGKSFGKRLPYHGWFWRSVDFYSKNIPIGVSELLKGFMENNKWYLPEGKLNEDQFKSVMEIIDLAMKFSEQGGDISKIRENTARELEKLWPLFQTFSVIVEY